MKMKMKNKIPDFIYTLLIPICSLLGIYIYYKTLYIPVLTDHIIISGIGFFILAGVTSFIIAVLVYENHRNLFSLFICSIFPLEIYTIITYRHIVYGCVILALITTIIIAGTFIYFAETSGLSLTNIKVRNKFILTAFSALAISLIAVFVSAGLNVYGDATSEKDNLLPMQKLYSSNVEKYIFEDKNPVLVKDNIETLSKIKEDTWKTLSDEEKLKVLQKFADVEASYFGLPVKPEVNVKKLSKKIAGNFSIEADTISLNSTYFKSFTGEELLETICHESFHAYEKYLCMLYLSSENQFKTLAVFQDVPDFIRELSDYKSGAKGDFEEYRSQKIEDYAFDYGERATIIYMNEIEEYLKGKDK